MKVVNLSVVGAMLFCLVSASADAAVIAQTGFNSDVYTTGLDIADPSQGAGESGWTSDWFRPDPASNGSATPVSTFFSEGDQSLHLNGTTSIHSRVARNFTPTTARYVTQTVDARVTTFSNEAVSFYLRGDGGAQQATAVSILSDGSISIKDGDNNGGSSNLTVFPSNTIVADEWYTLSITTDLETQKFTVSLDGVQSMVNGGEYFFRTTSPADPIEVMDNAEFWSAREFDGHYDNLIISAVPEPSTVALLGMVGVLGFVSYRRK